MSNKEWIDLIKENEEKIKDKIIECDKWNAKYQYDVYLYTDGDVYFFPNHGANSFIGGKNDKCIVVCSINNEYNEVDKDEIDSYDYNEWAQSLIDIRIYQLEQEF